MRTATPDVTAAPRRVLATRHAGWARAMARALAARGVRPNSVSGAGVGFATMAGVAFVMSASAEDAARAALVIVAAAAIQLRLLCNLLDGMLAVEEGLKTPTGEIANDLPDRVSDVVILVGAGYAVRDPTWLPALGWAAAIAAVFTAYVRVLGGSLHLTQHFIGPMAKQHRMFALTLASLLAAAEALADTSARAIPAALALIVAGSIVTAIRRTRRLVAEVNER
jgi:phosphatidylglycerophosphate synthase